MQVCFDLFQGAKQVKSSGPIGFDQKRTTLPWSTVQRIGSERFERIQKVVDQVLRVFDAHGDPQHAVCYPHQCPPLRTHFVIDGVSNRQHQCAGVSQVSSQHKYFETIEKLEDVDAIQKLDANQCAVTTAEQLSGAYVLWMRRQTRITDPRHLGMCRQCLRKRHGVAAASFHAQCQGFRPD